MNCTWKNCEEKGVHIQLDSNKKSWAVLCDKHNQELEEVIKGDDIKKLLSVYVKAQGGAEKASAYYCNRRKINHRNKI